MRKHIDRTISKKDEERKARHEANGERKEPKGLQLSKELNEIKEARIRELNLIKETAYVQDKLINGQLMLEA
jgi:hypothetical protein